MADQVNVEAQLKADGMSQETVADIQPLLANKNFRADAELQIAAANNAAKQAALARTLTDDYATTIGMFGSLMSASKAIAKKFPEVSTEMKQVATSATAAMGKVKNNAPVISAPVAPATPPVVVPPTPPAPVPHV